VIKLGYAVGDRAGFPGFPSVDGRRDVV